MKKLRTLKTISSENFNKVVDAVYDFGKLPANWDKDGALKIENTVIDRAIQLLYAIKKKGLLIHKDGNPFFEKYPTEEEMEETIAILKEEYRDDELYEPFLECISPSIRHHVMTIWPEPLGSIEFLWGWTIDTQAHVTIPIKKNQTIEYEIGYWDKGDGWDNSGESYTPDKLVITEKGNSFDYDEVVNIVFEKIYLCLPVFQKNSLVRWPITH